MFPVTKLKELRRREKSSTAFQVFPRKQYINIEKEQNKDNDVGPINETPNSILIIQSF